MTSVYSQGKEATTTDSIPFTDRAATMTLSNAVGLPNVPFKNKNNEGTYNNTNVLVRTAGQTVFIQRFNSAVQIYKIQNPKPKIKKNLLRREDSVKRSARRIKELTLANYPVKPTTWGMPCFLTTTYKDPERGRKENRTQQIADNDAFKRRLIRRYGKNVRMVGVFELQDGKRLKDKTQAPRNTIHTHWIVFNLPYNEHAELSALWGHGIVHIVRLSFRYGEARRSAAQMSNYLTKTSAYISKGLGAVSKSGQKTYFVSDGLVQPDSWTNSEKINLLFEYMRQNGFVCTSVSKEVNVPKLHTTCVYEEWNPPGT